MRNRNYILRANIRMICCKQSKPDVKIRISNSHAMMLRNKTRTELNKTIAHENAGCHLSHLDKCCCISITVIVERRNGAVLVY